ncbi:MAG TPA: hypothetical protein VNO52_13105, partial [Methylomirabilota bacterium]|nr:hypothetical protein [Methylomirabilota bacterium]
MDFISRPYMELFRPCAKSEYALWRIWYPAAPDAPKIPFQHIWGSDLWREYGGGPPDGSPGPVPGSQQLVPPGEPPPVGAFPIGPREWWENGVCPEEWCGKNPGALRFRIHARTEAGYTPRFALPLAVGIQAQTAGEHVSLFGTPLAVGIQAQTAGEHVSLFGTPLAVG